jgi:hypothetical protein
MCLSKEFFKIIEIAHFSGRALPNPKIEEKKPTPPGARTPVVPIAGLEVARIFFPAHTTPATCRLLQVPENLVKNSNSSLSPNKKLYLE